MKTIKECESIPMDYEDAEANGEVNGYIDALKDVLKLIKELMGYLDDPNICYETTDLYGDMRKLKQRIEG